MTTTSFRQSARVIELDLLACVPNEDVAAKWDEVIDELLRARKLPEDWDGQGAKAPTHEAIDTALKLVNHLRKKGRVPPDDYGAAVNGVITLGWHLGHILVVVEVSSPLRVEGYRWTAGPEKAEQFILLTGK